MMEKYNINQTTLKILGLYTSNYGRSLHLREIAREIEVDVKAIQLQLKRLEKSNAISYVLKGRNKEYYLNLNNLITKYYLMLAETFASINYLRNNFLVKRIVTEIENKVKGAILLFGSFAKGEETEESDIDFFVIGEKKPEEGAFTDIGSLIGRDINVKFASKGRFLKGLDDGDPLIIEVASNHIILKGVDDFCDILWQHYAGR